jgi:hypothetical protein
MSTFIQDDSIQGTSTVITEMAATAPIYAYTIDLNSLSGNSTSSINNLNATSATIFTYSISSSTNSYYSQYIKCFRNSTSQDQIIVRLRINIDATTLNNYPLIK